VSITNTIRAICSPWFSARAIHDPPRRDSTGAAGYSDLVAMTIFIRVTRIHC
jgi:hypothetical protein